MTIEILDFTLRTGARDEFIRRNEEVWTPALANREGFLGREVLIPPDDDDRVILLIYWRDASDPARFPRDEQEALDARMGDLVRDRRQQLLESVLPADQHSPKHRRPR